MSFRRAGCSATSLQSVTESRRDDGPARRELEVDYRIHDGGRACVGNRWLLAIHVVQRSHARDARRQLAVVPRDRRQILGAYLRRETAGFWAVRAAYGPLS